MDGRIMRCGIISSCQSASTSEIVKRSWAMCSSWSSAISCTRPFTCCCGAVFAVGAMVNEGLKLSEFVDATHCVNGTDAAQHASQIIFIFVQLHFIFIHSQVALLSLASRDRPWKTNVCLWINYNKKRAIKRSTTGAFQWSTNVLWLSTVPVSIQTFLHGAFVLCRQTWQGHMSGGLCVCSPSDMRVKLDEASLKIMNANCWNVV